MSTVLFDTPGPKAQARHRIMTVIAAVLAVLLLAWVLWKLYEEGEFQASVWEDMSQPNIWEAYWKGLLATLKAAASAIVLSVVFGAVLAIARLSDRAWVRFPARVVVEFFRAVPLLLQIMFVYFGLGLGLYWSLVLALTLYNGSVLAEVFRAGMLAVPQGQSEAAYAIGMRKNQVMRLVLMPQSITIMLPAIVSQCVIVLKDTALGQIVSYRELVVESQGIAGFIHHTFVPLAVAAAIFITINYSLSRLAIYLEARMARRGQSSGQKVDLGTINAAQNAGV
ncbi:amino acid ABC transporter permease [Nocardioides mesophilus]|uniref:Amino acid ABC transporter permease n=1 Tax=Nocardioides mesophilus TaxID=433659 RepID=A0A7G9R9I1_9ACTN|nr:amino acid ABC transporter permease [Nocardioides mesophilus]QNN52256.1 amino acid ABC transporter permease [Nocardioides mesophilus]